MASNGSIIDLNVEPIYVDMDISFFEQEQDGITVPSVSAPAIKSLVPLLRAESGGFTVPTAPTTSNRDDVEHSVEVLSMPREPYVGLTFAIAGAARDYYNSYAQHSGFSIRIDSTRESRKDNETKKVFLVCQKASVNKNVKADDDGPITEKKIVNQRRKDHVERTHCPARMIMRKTAPNQWEVVHLEKEHNHDLVRKFSLTKYMRSHRGILAEEKEFIKFLHGNGITIQLGYGFLRNEKENSFVWLFTQFKNAMGGKEPICIIKDQDLAMVAAIAIVFVTSILRNCRWHIMENARKRLTCPLPWHLPTLLWLLWSELNKIGLCITKKYFRWFVPGKKDLARGCFWQILFASSSACLINEQGIESKGLSSSCDKPSEKLGASGESLKAFVCSMLAGLLIASTCI